MQDRYTGPTAVFSGPMATPVTQYVKTIQIVDTATFTTLNFNFDDADPQQVNPNTLSYPVLMELYEVKSFRLLSGSIVVIFGHGK